MSALVVVQVWTSMEHPSRAWSVHPRLFLSLVVVQNNILYRIYCMSHRDECVDGWMDTHLS